MSWDIERIRHTTLNGDFSTTTSLRLIHLEHAVRRRGNKEFLPALSTVAHFANDELVDLDGGLRRDEAIPMALATESPWGLGFVA